MAVEGKPLAGKVALVTGGSRGIGAGIARKLAAWGCDLYLNFLRDRAAAQALAAELSPSTRVELAQADVGDDDEVTDLFAAIDAGHGRLDILIDNAAIGVFRPLVESTDNHWQFTFDSNAKATLRLARLARPLMMGRDGRLVMVTSGMAQRYLPGAGLLAAAKSAKETLVRYLSVELAGDGIVVSGIRPGLVETGIVELKPELRAAWEQRSRESAWKRPTTVADCGDAVALLCLEEARWLGGQIINVDGGASFER